MFSALMTTRPSHLLDGDLFDFAGLHRASHKENDIEIMGLSGQNALDL
jgi:hypothetical protein